MVANGESQSPFAWQGIAMLVLSRKKDEKIIIGDNITLMVIEIRGDKVRLGIDAPKEVAVHREEVYDAIQKESDNPVDAP
ncbi:Carbon storage regulator [hydrothermal vent metagenome]|uniref:Carbon storage regulator n=1 Tax=hydrothermal vent metagenome TaxID=652676 RepID=A0A3B1DRU4_9ZZZZ